MVPAAPDPERANQLAVMKRFATGLLAVVAVAFVGLVVASRGSEAWWWGYAIAAAEGSLVGGLADWFAVTAIFRHPLGIPIWHTAVIPRQKDQFGATLGAFIQDNFLSGSNIAERIRGADVPARLATWLLDPSHAALAAQRATSVLVGVADAVRDEDVQQLLHAEFDRLAAQIPVADLAHRGLALAVNEGRHQQVLDAVLRALVGYLDEHEEALRTVAKDKAPWWLPNPATSKIFRQALDTARGLIDEVLADPRHQARAAFHERATEFVDRLATDSDLRAKVDGLRREALDNPDIRAWVGGLWGEIKDALRAQAADPSSSLHRRLAEMAMTTGERLAADAALQEQITGSLDRAAVFVVDNYGDEISGIIASTISRWDGEETATKLELLLGRDLQFIRINGTVVGGLAGVAIHAVATFA